MDQGPPLQAKKTLTNYTFSYEDSTLLLEHKTLPNFNDSLKQLLAFESGASKKNTQKPFEGTRSVLGELFLAVVSAVDHRPSAFNHKVERY